MKMYLEVFMVKPFRVPAIEQNDGCGDVIPENSFTTETQRAQRSPCLCVSVVIRLGSYRCSIPL